MTNREKAVAYMSQLKMLPEVIQRFEEGQLFRSETMGILFDATDEQMEEVKRLEADGNVVWHIIFGTYILGGSDKVDMEAYLLVTDEDPDELYMEGSTVAYAFAYVKNLTWDDCSEYGEVCVKQVHGGLTRVG